MHRANGRSRTAAILQEKRELLELSILFGPRYAHLLTPFQEWINLADGDSSQAFLERHASMLDPEFDRLLRYIAEQHSDDERTHGVICHYRTLLHHCRSVGVADAYRTLPIEQARSGTQQSTVSESARALVYEIVQGRESLGVEERISKCREALTLLTSRGNIRLQAAVYAELGFLLIHSTEGDKRSSIEESIRCLQKAFTVTTYEEFPDDWARTMMHLGMAFQNRIAGDRSDNLEKAIEYYQECLKVIAPEETPNDWAGVMLNLGNAYKDRSSGERLSNVEKAIAFYQSALTAHSKERSPMSWAAVHGNLGVIYRLRSAGTAEENIERSIEHFESALEVETVDSSPERWAQTMMNLGNAFAHRLAGDNSCNVENALECYRQSQLVRTPDRMPREWAISMLNMGAAFGKRVKGERSKNIEEQINCLRSASSMLEQDSSEWALAMLGLGNAYLQRINGIREDNLVEAVRFFQMALPTLQSQGHAEGIHRCGRHLGKAWAKLKRYGDAIDAFNIAIQVLDASYESSFTRIGKEAALREVGSLYLECAWCLAMRGSLQAAAVALEQGRARQLRETLGRDRAELCRLRDFDTHLADRFEQAAARVREGDCHQLREATEIEFERDDSKVREESEVARNQFQAALSAIRHLPGYERFLDRPDFSDIESSLLGDDTAVVYCAATPYGGLALVLTRTSNGEVSVDSVICEQFDESRLHSLLFEVNDNKQLVGGIVAVQLGIAASSSTSVRSAIELLGTEFVSSLGENLEAAAPRRIVLIPCGLLSLAPLHAATYQTDSGAGCLIDRYVVHYSPSVTSWSDSVRAAGRCPSDITVLGVGNPLPTVHDNLASLPYAGVEAASIVRLYGTENSEELLEHQASKAATLAAIGKVRIAHFACHGEFDVSTPLESRLILSDGDLTLREILGGSALGIESLRLVVLSACQSGITEYRSIPDEAIGLPAGFLQAGVAGVIATLWPVNDLTTALVMIKCYEILASGKEPADSLCAAQKWLRDASNEDLLEFIESCIVDMEIRNELIARLEQGLRQMRRYEDSPLHWAPFVYVGA